MLIVLHDTDGKELLVNSRFIRYATPSTDGPHTRIAPVKGLTWGVTESIQEIAALAAGNPLPNDDADDPKPVLSKDQLVAVVEKLIRDAGPFGVSDQLVFQVRLAIEMWWGQLPPTIAYNEMEGA